MNGMRIVGYQSEARKIYLEEQEELKKIKRFKMFKSRKVKTSICSQCTGKMRKDLADAQIENKRENAPICMACIMGYKRKYKYEQKT